MLISLQEQILFTIQIMGSSALIVYCFRREYIIESQTLFIKQAVDNIDVLEVREHFTVTYSLFHTSENITWQSYNKPFDTKVYRYNMVWFGCIGLVQCSLIIRCVWDFFFGR